MINFVSVIDDHQKESVELASDIYQGQWGYHSGVNSAGNVKVTVVSSATHAAYARDKLGIVMADPIDIEGSDVDHDLIDSGSMAVFVVGEKSGIVVEDDYLTTRTISGTAVSATDFSAATYGDALYLNSEGYPTDSSATDYDSGSVKIGEFQQYINGIVFYRIF